jgi:hypothetical protein
MVVVFFVRTNGSSPARVDHQGAIWRQWLRQFSTQIAVTENVAVVSVFRHWSIDRHDISVRSSRQKKKLAILNHFFIPVPPTLQRSTWIDIRKSQTLWLFGSMLAVSLEAADHGRGFGADSSLLQTSQFSNALVLFPSTSRLQGPCFIFPALSKKQSSLSGIKKSGG